MLPRHKRSDERAQFLADVLTTAVEGGINHWAAVSGYRWYSPTVEGGRAEHVEGQANAYVTVHENEVDTDGEDGCVVRSIGVDDIARVLGEIRRTPRREGPEWMHDDLVAEILAADRLNDAGEIDAGACDCLMQIAVLGKVVYG